MQDNPADTKWRLRTAPAELETEAQRRQGPKKNTKKGRVERVLSINNMKMGWVTTAEGELERKKRNVQHH